MSLSCLLHVRTVLSFSYGCHLLQVFLGQNGVRDIEGNELPRLVYVSREKRPGFDHHKKAGAMNALVSLSLKHTTNLIYVCDSSY